MKPMNAKSLPRWIAATALGGAAFAGIAYAAQEPQQRTAPPATQAEMMARADQRFAKLDANRDGVLTADERPQRRGMRGRGEGRMGESSERGMRGMRGLGRGPGVAITAVQFRTRALICSVFESARKSLLTPR